MIVAALAGIALTAFTLSRREAGLRFAGHQPFGFSAITRRESLARPWFDGQLPHIGRWRFPNPDPDVQRVREIIEFNGEAAGIIQIARTDPDRVPMLEVAGQFVPLQSDERPHRDLMVIIPKAFGMVPIKAKLHYGREIADLELPPMRESPPWSGERSVAIGRYNVRFKVPRQAVPHVLHYVEVTVDGRRPGEVVVLTSDHDKTWSMLVGDSPGIWPMYAHEKMPLGIHLSTATQSDLTLTASVKLRRQTVLRTPERVRFLRRIWPRGRFAGRIKWATPSYTFRGHGSP